uniref:Uncharacterized protein n=1 Tax=Trichogramma kaykai TaxID=54128 RepID=A0ABD2WK40_9HYME
MGCTSLEEKRRFFLGVHVYWAVSLWRPHYLSEMFQRRYTGVTPKTRNSSLAQLTVPDSSSEYCSLTCFFWSNILSLETYIQVKHQIDHNSHKLLKRKEEQIHLYYSLWAWGLPMIFTLSLWALKNEPSLPRNILKRNIHSYDCCKYCE